MKTVEASTGHVKRRIRILYTIPNFITAGSGRAMLNIIERLDRERFDPAVAVLKKGGALDAVVAALGIPFLEHPFTVEAIPYAGFPRRAWRAARAFKPYAFDIWHSFHYSADYSEPVIARLAGARAWVFTKKNMNWHRKAWYVRSLLADGIAAQNQDIINAFYCTAPFNSRAQLIHTGVDSQLFTSPASSENQIANNPDVVKIGLLAHILPIKGHLVAVDAMANIPNCRLFFAGREADASYCNTLRNRVRQLQLDEEVVFLGDVTDTSAFLKSMDIMLLPSLSRGEGCPVALLEAMSTGLPCIASNIPGARDVIRSGIDGLLVPPENAAALSKAILRCVNDAALRSTLGDAARQRVLTSFTIEREVRKYEAFYEEVLERQNMGCSS